MIGPDGFSDVSPIFSGEINFLVRTSDSLRCCKMGLGGGMRPAAARVASKKKGRFGKGVGKPKRIERGGYCLST